MFSFLYFANIQTSLETSLKAFLKSIGIIYAIHFLESVGTYLPYFLHDKHVPSGYLP